MESGFITAWTFGILFSADCFWGLISSLGALPPKISPSPRPVGALVRAWTQSACRPVSPTTRRPRRVPSHPWTHQMSLRRRYMLTLSTVLIPVAASSVSICHVKNACSRFPRRCPKQFLPGNHSSEKQLQSAKEGWFICPSKHFYAYIKVHQRIMAHKISMLYSNESGLLEKE